MERLEKEKELQHRITTQWKGIQEKRKRGGKNKKIRK
jgi:hypothetical protein